MVNIIKPDIMEFTQKEFGDIYAITIKNADGTDANLAQFTAVKFKIISSKDGTELLDAATVSIDDPTNEVRWTMLTGETDIPDTEAGDDHIGIIIFTAAGKSRRIHPYLIVKVYRAKDVSIP